MSPSIEFGTDGSIVVNFEKYLFSSAADFGGALGSLCDYRTQKRDLLEIILSFKFVLEQKTLAIGLRGLAANRNSIQRLIQ